MDCGASGGSRGSWPNILKAANEDSVTTPMNRRRRMESLGAKVISTVNNEEEILGIRNFEVYGKWRGMSIEVNVELTAVGCWLRVFGCWLHTLVR